MLNLTDWFDRFVDTIFSHDSAQDSYIDATSQVHVEATVVETIFSGKAGQIKFQGSLWIARSSSQVALLPGQIVYVVNRDNITLYVEPVPAAIDLDSMYLFWVAP